MLSDNKHTETMNNTTNVCPEFLQLAERELSAFTIAVHQTSGAEAAGRAAECWLAELGSYAPEKYVPEEAHRHLRMVSVLAASRLAHDSASDAKPCTSASAQPYLVHSKQNAASFVDKPVQGMLARLFHKFFVCALHAANDLIQVSLML